MRNLIVFLLMLASAAGGFLAAPLFASEKTFVPFEPREFDGALPSELSCNSLADAGVSNFAWSSAPGPGITATAGRGTDHVALKVDLPRKTITMLSGADVKIGRTEGEKLSIVKDADDFLTAIQIGVQGAVVTALLIKKATGNTVFTKASQRFAFSTGQSLFLNCR